MQKRNIMLLILVALCILVIAYTDMIIRPGYIIKTAVKAPIFFLVPIIYSKFCGEYNPFSSLRSSSSGLKTALALGVAIYTAVVGFYLVANSLADLSGIKTSLEANLGINKDNFIAIGLYVAVVNSFLEEWFFRGFVFGQLRKSSRPTAYVISSLSFSIYHIAIMDGMFSLPLLLLTLLGLFLGGTIFNYLNEKNNSIYPSWFCHAFANFAMNTVGIMIFYF